MIEFSLCCDECGRIIVASNVSAADARAKGRLLCFAGRFKRRDLCSWCIEQSPTLPVKDR